MDPRHLFVDERLSGGCSYCGGIPDSADHSPSKVFLDEPYPLNLPTVPACETCNHGFSLDEEYVACFLDVVISGTTEPAGVGRERVRRKLIEKPALADRIVRSRQDLLDGTPSWMPEHERVRNVMLKLARGHVTFEMGESRVDPPDWLHIAPIEQMGVREQEAFFANAAAGEAGWPELGSRAFLRAAGKRLSPVVDDEGWCRVQDGRYRYRIDGSLVHIVLSEYLACAVAWE